MSGKAQKVTRGAPGSCAAGQMARRRGAGLDGVPYALLFALFYYGMGTFVSVLTLYLADEGLSTTDIGLVTSSTALFTIALQPLVGYVADAVGSTRGSALACLLVILAGGVGVALGRAVPVLFVANGIAQALIIASVPLLDNLAVHSGHPYGHIRAAGSAGYAVGVQVSGILYEHVSSLAAFVAFFVATGLAVVCLLRVRDVDSRVAEGPGAAGDVVEAAGDGPSGVRDKGETGLAPTLRDLCGNGKYLLFLVISFIFLGLHYANIAYMPLLVVAVGGGATSLGSMLLAQSLFEMLVVYASPWLSGRLSDRALLALSAAVMAARMLWYATMPSAAALLATFFFQGLTVGIFYVLTVRIVSSVVSETHVNTALAVASVTGKGLGALAFQLAGSQVLAAWGFGALYLCLGVAGMACVALCLGFGKEKRSARVSRVGEGA